MLSPVKQPRKVKKCKLQNIWIDDSPIDKSDLKDFDQSLAICLLKQIEVVEKEIQNE